MKAKIDSFDGGFAPDHADFNLPEGTFTDIRNARVLDGALTKNKGTTAILGSLSISTIWAQNVYDGSQVFWVYANESVIYATAAGTHAQISSASYNADPELGYTGGPFHGYLILNDGATAPQSWNPALANKVIPLANWPANTTAKVIRPFNDFLVALRVTDTGVYNGRLVRWSDRAQQAALPASWDYTDPTNQAGINELGQTSDFIVDALPLRDSLIVYKQYHTWLMQYAGGDDVFSFRELFNHVGMLSEDCAVAFGAKHLVLTDSDLVLHDGSSVDSIVDKRTRKWLFSRIDPTYYKRCFVALSRREREAWICFPESGNAWPQTALVWNWAEDKFHVRDLGQPTATGIEGPPSSGGTTYASLSASYGDTLLSYDSYGAGLNVPQLVLWPSAIKTALLTESGNQLNGANIVSYAERSNMLLTKDVGRIKRVHRVRPKISGTAGQILNVYVGARSTPDSAVDYSGPFRFVIGTDYKIDCRVSGRYICLKVYHTDNGPFTLSGFDVDFDNDGDR